MIKKKILILYDYFDPAYKAGGPIRSIVNLIGLMEDVFDYYILSTNEDHDGSTLKVEKDKWVKYGNSSQVMYLSKDKRGFGSIGKIISEIEADVIYLNGIFSLSFVVIPLWVLRKATNTKIIIAPRGMLQAGALQIKSLKKKIYLRVLNYLLSLHDKVKWHATDKQELLDIKQLNAKSQVRIAGNIPKFAPNFSSNLDAALDFVSISLLTRKKNHSIFIKALGNIKSDRQITYHIYGPVSDQVYFNGLKKEIAQLPQHIKIEYKGVLHPSEVSNKLKEYRFYVLTSFGENFGHSIFEAFNQGVPVIISDQTPWLELNDKKAGWDVNLSNPKNLENAIFEAINMNDDSYADYQKGARGMAEEYMNTNDFKVDYQRLFDFDQSE